MLHGINGTAERIGQRTGLDQAGPREGFVVVFPQSRGNAWNRFAPGKFGWRWMALEAQDRLSSYRPAKK